MATKTDDEKDSCIFQWKIKNISHCSSLEKVLKLCGPEFIAEAVEGTKWSLWFYPMRSENEIYVSIYLNREKDCSGPDVIKINFQLALLGNDDSVLKKETQMKATFAKDYTLGYERFEAREKVFGTERETFLQEDYSDDTVHDMENGWDTFSALYARTIFKLNEGSFSGKFYNFSTLKFGALKNKDDLVDFDLVLKKDKMMDVGKNLEIRIKSFNEIIKYFSLKVFIVDSEGKKENCGVYKCFIKDLKKGILSIPFFTEKLMNNEKRYFPNDVLTLDCEYTTLTKTVLREFESCVIYSKLESESEYRNQHHFGIEKSQNTSVLAGDLKSLYMEGILCDTELRTSTRKFPAHKNILSARSPVFRRMFGNDMKEKNSGHVDITDLENDTVQRMLLYIYTDSLENLELESASKLYAAADKYEILHLRSLCSCFLKENLCPTNACDILAMADLHQDTDLKSFVKDYILDHDKEVFGSQEWKDFMGANSKLAADIMYMKVFPAQDEV